MPGFPDLAVPLADRAVIVRLAAERDIPEVLIAYQDDPDLHLLLGRARPPSGAELGRLAERADADRSAGRELTLTILEDRSDTCRGQLHVRHLDWENARADVCIWVAPGARGRGLGSQALGIVARWLLRNCGLERVQVTTVADNERMIRCAERAGFADEGVLRAYARAYTGEHGGRVDSAVLSMVRRDLTG